MDSLNYLDFELQVERAGDSYRAEVLRSPAGEATTTFTLPFSPESIENLILKLGARRGRSRGLGSNELTAARELGSGLFDAVFAGDIRACLRRSLDTAESQPDTGLRIKLRLQSVGELADLPWEFLYDSSQGRFLAQSNYTPLVRYVEMPERIRPLAIELPLRVLVMISAPDDPDYPKLDVEHEKHRVEEALAPLRRSGIVEIDWLEKATLAHLRDALRNNTYHAFHFIGHGSFDAGAQEGLLILEDELNRGMRAGAHRIGPLLHDHRSLRLAVLNACEGARNSRDDPFSGIATNLVRQGIPAVVAMQFEITDDAAITFASGFYSAIAEGYPVDMAVAEARSAILVQPNDIEWATPVLYMRSPDGHLFDLSQAAPSAPGVLEHPVLEPVDHLADAGEPRAAEAIPTLEEALVTAAVPVVPDLAPEAASPSPRTEPDVPPALEVEVTPAAVAITLQSIGRGFAGMSRSGRYRLTVTNPGDMPRDLGLEAHLADGGYATSLPRTLSLEPRETRSLRFSISPKARRWRGRRFEVPFTIAAHGGDGSPPSSIGGVFEDRPGSFLPYAGGFLLGCGAIAVVALLLLGGDETPVPPAGPTETTAANASTGASSAQTSVPPAAQSELVFFSSTRGGGSHDIYSVTPDGSEWHRLTDNPANEVMPAATLDGRKVAFVSNRNGSDQVYVMNSDGSDQVQAVEDAYPNLEPDLSPDGATVAFERKITEDYFDVYLWLPGGAYPLTSGGGIDPDWSPDGSRMIFASSQDGNNEIYVSDAQGYNVTRLTFDAGNDVEPAWSPGGSRILFESNRDGNPEIYVMNADGSNQRRLTFDPANDQDPVWSPDSTRIAFETDRDGNWEVYLMDLDGGALTNLSNHPGEDRKPSWSLVPGP